MKLHRLLAHLRVGKRLEMGSFVETEANSNGLSVPEG